MEGKGNVFCCKSVGVVSMALGDINEKPPSKDTLHTHARIVSPPCLKSRQLWRQWADRFNVADLWYLHPLGLGRCGPGYLDICPKVKDRFDIG